MLPSIKSFEAYFEKGIALSRTGQKQDAIESFLRALQVNPHSAAAFSNLGLMLAQIGRSPEAAVYLKQAIRLDPTLADAHNNLGLALADLGKLPESEAAYEQALTCDPRHIESHTNLAGVYAQQGRASEAEACCKIALWLNPDSVSAHWHRALALLQMGNFEQGLPEYEWRFRRASSKPRPFDRPMWNGTALEGKTILLHMEQGLGDAIQFARYIPMVKERGGSIALECRESLIRLFGGFPGVEQLVPEGAPLPKFDVHAPLMSLPFIFKTTFESIPAEVPYLNPDPKLVEKWRESLGSVSEFKVGIAWQGNPNHKWDRHRSIPLSRFESIAEVPGIRLFSLQRNQGVEQIRTNMRKVPLQLLLEDSLADRTAWAEAAAIVANLDLMITVDTATAHLAGALGVPTWVLLSKASDWRWLLDRSDSPWYPTMRLFRQEQLGEWDTVFEAVAQALEEFSAEGKHRRNAGTESATDST
jgi:Flp pilus assembly protein TadD